MYEFDEATAVTLEDDRVVKNGERRMRFAAHMVASFNVGEVVNGGYVNGVLAACVSRISEQHPHPATFTTHFLGRTTPGAVAVEVRLIKQGRSSSTVVATLFQNDRPTAAAIVNLIDLTHDHTPRPGPSLPPRAVPPIPRPEHCECIGGPTTRSIALDSRLRRRRASVEVAQGNGVEVNGWLGLSDGRPLDVHVLSFLVDALKPLLMQAKIEHAEKCWFPTTELTWHCRAIPRGEWLQFRACTRHLKNGAGELDVEWWDETGELVALSRQYFTIVSWKKNIGQGGGGTLAERSRL
eukprot:TRINITY_DN4525_c0_g1_i1.p2 TRINITY_DN4525_c0_g1~~TRINITY_DN4525_c0_g1_i1.p2  ORF type:complete len:331 (+),score=67.81 TRINITY_DN4525_c0_g1_i1:110-994(+)